MSRLQGFCYVYDSVCRIEEFGNPLANGCEGIAALARFKRTSVLWFGEGIGPEASRRWFQGDIYLRAFICMIEKNRLTC